MKEPRMTEPTEDLGPTLQMQGRVMVVGEAVGRKAVSIAFSFGPLQLAVTLDPDIADQVAGQMLEAATSARSRIQPATVIPNGVAP